MIFRFHGEPYVNIVIIGYFGRTCESTVEGLFLLLAVQTKVFDERIPSLTDDNAVLTRTAGADYSMIHAALYWIVFLKGWEGFYEIVS